MRVVLRDGAYADLDRIFNWIAKDRPTSAPAVVGRILDSIEHLGRFPRLGYKGRYYRDQRILRTCPADRNANFVCAKCYHNGGDDRRTCYILGMKAKALNDALKRVETWPEDAQAMLAELAFEIDGELRENKVPTSAAELEGID